MAFKIILDVNALLSGYLTKQIFFDISITQGNVWSFPFTSEFS